MKHIFTSSTTGVQYFMLLSLLTTIYALFQYQITYVEVLLIFSAYFIYGCLGIVVTYHRYLTHNSYSARQWLVKFFSLVGCLGGTGSPLAWVAIHINHHLKSDKPNDPHSPHHKGIKIFMLDYINEVDNDTKWRMRKLVTDRYQQFLHRYYFLIMVSYMIVLYYIGGLHLVIFFHIIPAFITGIMSNVVNYAGHKPSWLGSYRTYNLNDYSSNNWLWAIPSWGESWHNNHHRFPKRSYFGDKWYEIDISGLIINLIKK